MSNMGNTSPASLLPEDIEERLIKAQKIIADLDALKTSLEESINIKKNEKEEAERTLLVVRADLDNITSLLESRKKELSDKETQLNQKESALEVYANALQEKENKINKYLSIFDRMKDVISK